MTFEAQDVSDLANRIVLPPPFYVEEVLPKEGVMLMFGGPKVGKSYMAKQLGFALATGIPFLGFRTMRARTVIVQFEISLLAYQWRLSRLLTTNPVEPGWLYTISPGLVFLDEREGYEQLLEALLPLDPEVIILDCLQACFGGDENDSRDIGRIISRVEDLKNRNRASLVLIHHSRKGPQLGNFAELARGQSKLTGWPDTLFYLHKDTRGVKAQFMCRQATREVLDQNLIFENGIFRPRR